jgi:hypothetical protein
MKTSKIFLKDDKSNSKETSMKIGAGKLLKPVNIILMLLLITLMSSCFVRSPGPGHEGHEGRHQHNEHHDDRH